MGVDPRNKLFLCDSVFFRAYNNGNSITSPAADAIYVFDKMTSRLSATKLNFFPPPDSLFLWLVLMFWRPIKRLYIIIFPELIHFAELNQSKTCHEKFSI